MHWTSILAMMVFLSPESDGFFFGTPNRRSDRPPLGRRMDTWKPRPYWDRTWNRPYYPSSPVLRRFHHSRMDEYGVSSGQNSYHPGNSYRAGHSYNRGNPYHPGNAFHQRNFNAGNAHYTRSRYPQGSSYRPATSYYRDSSSSYRQHPDRFYRGNIAPQPNAQYAVGRRTDESSDFSQREADPVGAEASNPAPQRVAPPTSVSASADTSSPVPESAPAPAPVNASALDQDVETNVTEEEKAHNYMRHAELLVKIATRFDTYGCFRRLVCECEYYSNRLNPGTLTMEEKLILHVFGMERRREEDDMDRARFHHAAAAGEAARELGLPDPCPEMSPKCPQNMVKKLWVRHAKVS